VDYHSGNGSLAIHWNDPSVFFASLHMDLAVDYPFCAGFPDQVRCTCVRGAGCASAPRGTDVGPAAALATAFSLPTVAQLLAVEALAPSRAAVVLRSSCDHERVVRDCGLGRRGALARRAPK
jgi:hypothetical protein